MLYLIPFHSIGFQQTASGTVEDAIKKFKDRNDNDKKDSSKDNDNDKKDSSKDNDNDREASSSSDDKKDSSKDNDRESNVRDVISKFTNRNGGDESDDKSGDTQQQEPAPEQGTPSLNTQQEPAPITAQTHEDGQDDPILDPAHRIGSGVIDTGRHVSNLIPPGLLNAKEKVDSGLDQAQSSLDNAIERAKYRNTGSLPSGSGFN